MLQTTSTRAVCRPIRSSRARKGQDHARLRHSDGEADRRAISRRLRIFGEGRQVFATVMLACGTAEPSRRGSLSRAPDKNHAGCTASMPCSPQQRVKILAQQVKNAAISCHCEAAAAVAIFKPKVWHPVAKHGSTKQKGILLAKNGICRFIPRNRISLRNDKSHC